MWSAIGEIIFTVVVGYMGAIELLFVAKQLYHLAFQHQRRQMLLADDRGLRALQERIDREIVEAAQKEILGYNAMKDGILYKDGFRIDPGEINDHETPHRQSSGGTKSDRELSEDRTKNIVKKEISKATSESEVRQEVIEEPCVKIVAKRVASPRPETREAQPGEDQQTIPTQKVKTQIGQTNLEEYVPPPDVEVPVNTQTLPESAEDTQSSPLRTEMHFEEHHREEPEGQDVPEPQYSDEYLRSLDGIKKRPLVRDDGTRRRRAFKKRHSSDSTSSRESRASREEEVKVFTSLEEEEFESIRRGDSQYAPITYSSDPNLLKTGKHQRRHKKSPIKDTNQETEDSKGSLEMLDEETSSPWGDVKPEHYRDTEFWKREKAVSIEEESDENAASMRGEDIQKQQAGELIASPTPTKNIPQFSSFEEATHSQHQDAMSTLTNQKPKDEAKKSSEKDVEKVSSPPSQSDAGLQGVLVEQETSAETEETVACGETDKDAHHNVGLRRSPRIDDIDRYEERLCEEDANAKPLPMRESPNPSPSPAHQNQQQAMDPPAHDQPPPHDLSSNETTHLVFTN